jgi:hypothetical protein
MLLVTHMATLQAEQRRETQWHPRVQVQLSVEKRAPYRPAHLPAVIKVKVSEACSSNAGADHGIGIGSDQPFVYVAVKPVPRVHPHGWQQ